MIPDVIHISSEELEDDSELVSTDSEINNMINSINVS